MLKEAMFYKALSEGDVQCHLCSHRCRIAPSKFGFCGVRQNREGKLVTHAYGGVIAAHIDPVEKKPLYHYLPGTVTFSIATIGCNFHCTFCQNWQISQTSARDGRDLAGHPLAPQDAVNQAIEHNCRSISYTYTEPTIFFEYAFEIARIAHDKGLGNIFVTNGYMGTEALETISPFLDACNVDLKSFRDEYYVDLCKAHLQPVLDSIRLMKKLHIWVEVTTLVVPGENDSDDELKGLAGFIASVDPEIPWHISRFHPDYQLTDRGPTPMETLRRAVDAGKEAGLRYIYTGNVAGISDDTLCPHCRESLIHRRGFMVLENRVTGSSCPYCGKDIAGIFS
ncbi:MAG: AmmeMemoRadiSam system radical SAM enzyme [bacterium]